MTLELDWVALFTVRLGFAVVLARTWFRADLSFKGQPHPKGLARVLSFAALAEPRARLVIHWLTRAVLLAYVAGVALPLCAVWLSFYTLAVGLLWSSQGATGHAFQPLALVMLVQAVVMVQAAGVAGMWTGGGAEGALQAQYMALSWCQQALIATYFTAGLTKLGLTPLRWLRRSRYLPLSAVKATEQNFQTDGDQAARTRRLAIAETMARRPGLTFAVAAGGLALELGSPLMLLAPPLAMLGGVALLLFHRINGLTMGLSFPQLQILCLALLANPFFLVAWS